MSDTRLVTTMTDGKRRRTEDSDGLRNIVWDLENILLETDSGGSSVARYTLAPRCYGIVLAMRRSNATSFYHFDALGSTDRLTDSSQNALVSYLYRAFGEQTILSGSSASRFTWVGALGYYRQPDSSDYWVRARVCRPSIGRWVSRDRVWDGVALGNYTYGGNRAAVAVDPSGLKTCTRIAWKKMVDCNFWDPKNPNKVLGTKHWSKFGRKDNCTDCKCPKLKCWLEIDLESDWIVQNGKATGKLTDQQVKGDCGLFGLVLEILINKYLGGYLFAGAQILKLLSDFQEEHPEWKNLSGDCKADGTIWYKEFKCQD